MVKPLAGDAEGFSGLGDRDVMGSEAASRRSAGSGTGANRAQARRCYDPSDEDAKRKAAETLHVPFAG